MNNNINLIPYVTEKSSKLIEDNQYVFLSLGFETKIDIKKYFEQTYSVKVDNVNVLRKPSKTVRRGRVIGKKRQYKKFIIKVNSESNKEKLDELF